MSRPPAIRGAAPSHAATRRAHAQTPRPDCGMGRRRRRIRGRSRPDREPARQARYCGHAPSSAFPHFRRPPLGLAHPRASAATTRASSLDRPGRSLYRFRGVLACTDASGSSWRLPHRWWATPMPICRARYPLHSRRHRRQKTQASPALLPLARCDGACSRQRAGDLARVEVPAPAGAARSRLPRSPPHSPATARAMVALARALYRSPAAGSMPSRC